MFPLLDACAPTYRVAQIDVPANDDDISLGKYGVAVG